jgi:hypothetical protein
MASLFGMGEQETVAAAPAYDAAAAEAKAKKDAKSLAKSRAMQESKTVKTTPLGLYGTQEPTKKKTVLG